VPRTCRYLYCPRPTDEFVGEILYRRRGRTETDFDLYLDADTQALFVVGSVSHQAGPSLNNTHTLYTVDEFLTLEPWHRRRMADMLRARVARLAAAHGPVRPH
jgi:hypothetical protein